ncbi:MAG: type VI secretion system tube protein Hcp [Armatimonadetes bacterium]|nr:type VI secretion system tube protein Hcp [Armatimonadota bacterium]
MSLGREGTIEVLSLTMGVSTPRDTASGLATGRRAYEPIVITKRIDKSSPLLARALTNNEVIEGTVHFYRPAPDGTTHHYYTLQFANARVASIRQFLPNVLDPATASLPPYEEVAFVFQTIKWESVDAGITHEDSMSGRSLGSTTPTESIVQPGPTAPRTINRGIARPQ